MLKAVILAAGAGTRMQSKLPKVMHTIIDRPLVQYVIEAAKEAGATSICVVVGHGKEAVMGGIKEQVAFVEQKEQLGTGHAVLQAQSFIGDQGETLILFGDTPMITGTTLKALIHAHKASNNAVTVLATQVSDPHGYGRIIRDAQGTFVKSVEHKDASASERKVREINSGMYLFNSKALLQALGQLTTHNAQGEYYLPDTLKILMEQGQKVDALCMDVVEEVLGVNDRVQLAQATEIIQERINRHWMMQGVTFVSPSQTWIGKDVTIGMDTTIYPGSMLTGSSHIGTECVIGPNAHIYDTTIGSSTQVVQSTLKESHIGEATTIGPYAYIRPNCTIGNYVKVGDFVEIKNSVIGDGSKVPHLTYIGDADVGEKVNFGCGCVVVNYDGAHKYRTVVKDHAFIGCNTNLVSPVVVESYGYTAAGSTITQTVPDHGLGIARARQHNIEGWVNRKKSTQS